MDSPQLTGHAQHPATGRSVAPAPEGTALTLRREDLPLRITFDGRRYLVIATRNGGLIMTGA